MFACNRPVDSLRTTGGLSTAGPVHREMSPFACAKIRIQYPAYVERIALFCQLFLEFSTARRALAILTNLKDKKYRNYKFRHLFHALDCSDEPAMASAKLALPFDQRTAGVPAALPR